MVKRGSDSSFAQKTFGKCLALVLVMCCGPAKADYFDCNIAVKQRVAGKPLPNSRIISKLLTNFGWSVIIEPL
jgi:hypothetical protein